MEFIFISTLIPLAIVMAFSLWSIEVKLERIANALERIANALEKANRSR